MSVKNALSAYPSSPQRIPIIQKLLTLIKIPEAPKKEAERGAHRGDKATAPKVATFGNDRSIQAGEFESSPEQSSADTGIHGKAVLSTQSGEFESTPEASHADTGIHGSAVSAAQAGEFESNPVPREW